MLKLWQDGPVLRVTLDRPEVRNAFNDELISKLTETFENLDSKTRVVVLSGEGKSFSAGGDLDWMRRAASYSEDQNREDALKLGALFTKIATCPAVVISKVHGAAFGGGCGLVACSDVAVAERSTIFSFSEVKLGLVPATISVYVIPKIGAGNARWLFSTGEAFDADTALRIGLIHGVGGSDELDQLVDIKAQAVLKAGPEAVKVCKQICLEGPYSMAESAALLAKARSGDEGREGVQAFLEKRPASYCIER